MSASNSPVDPGVPIVIDASVIINLIATKESARIISAFPNPFVVTESVLRELCNGNTKGHSCGQQLARLIGDGVLEQVRLRSTDYYVYRSLVEGGLELTLDDGEASTIAYAVGSNGIALIDEHKARQICASRFPTLRIASTAELLLHNSVTERLSESAQGDVIFLALRDARMHVPRHLLGGIVERIGGNRASLCPSLPRSYRCANRSADSRR